MGVMDAIQGILWFFFGVIFTIITFPIVTNIFAIITDETLNMMLWVGMIIIWILAIIVIPAIKIMGNSETL